MVDLITRRLGEARGVIGKLKSFTAVLDSIIIFTFLFILFILFGVELILAVVPALLYLILRLILPVRNTRVMETITRRNPLLDERLQTAYDNEGESNLIVDNLICRVSQKIDDTPYSSFVSNKDIFLRVFVVIFLSFTLLTMNFFHVREFSLDTYDDLFKQVIGDSSPDSTGDKDRFSTDDGDWEKGEENPKDEREKIGGGSGGEIPGFSEGPIAGSGGGAGDTSGDDIYGAPSSASIEGRDVDMEIHPEYGGEIEIKDVNEEVSDAEFRLPREIRAAGTPEQEPVEYAEMIKEYFGKLSKAQ